MRQGRQRRFAAALQMRVAGLAGRDQLLVSISQHGAQAGFLFDAQEPDPRAPIESGLLHQTDGVADELADTDRAREYAGEGKELAQHRGGLDAAVEPTSFPKLQPLDRDSGKGLGHPGFEQEPHFLERVARCAWAVDAGPGLVGLGQESAERHASCAGQTFLRMTTRGNVPRIR